MITVLAPSYVFPDKIIINNPVEKKTVADKYSFKTFLFFFKKNIYQQRFYFFQLDYLLLFYREIRQLGL